MLSEFYENTQHFPPRRLALNLHTFKRAQTALLLRKTSR